MPMKNRYVISLLSCMAVCYVGCTESDEIPTTSESPPPYRVWTASVEAVRDSIIGMDEDEIITRSLYYGGNSGTRYALVWDKGDDVMIYKGDTHVGTLSPSVTGQETTTLTGTLTGAIEVGDNLSLYFPSRDMDFSGQDGSIATLSSKYMYQQSTTTVTAAKEAGATLSMSVSKLTYPETFVRFTLTDVETGERIHPEKFQFFAASGKLVKTRTISGITTYFTDSDPLTVTTSETNGEYPGEIYVGILNDNGKNDTYRFLVWAGDNVYAGPTKAMTAISNNGALGNLVRSVQKTTPMSALTVEPIATRTYTGSAIVPDASEVVVKDGTKTLVQGTDYVVELTDNLNAGTGTLTITGLADQGSIPATPYLGTRTIYFPIEKATPVITLASGKATSLETASVGSCAVVSIKIGDLDVTDWMDVVYSSNNEAVAIVGMDGSIAGLDSGYSTITAFATPKAEHAANLNSALAQCVVTVGDVIGTQGTVDPWGNGDTENEDVKF